MIPVKLSLEGFLSYRNLVQIDFGSLDVACISGANGAGKSSLLDAITWVLFGRARRNDDALIHSTLQSCLVVLEFDYEGNCYRVERSKERGKGARLEFQVKTSAGNWKPLTEAGLRATEDRIRAVLHMDYDTFINSSFFLQGKADLFTQQAPARRKEILSSILGLEVWDLYHEEASRRRRAIDEDLNVQRQMLEDILEELSHEQERREKLTLLLNDLNKSAALRLEKEKLQGCIQAEKEKIKSHNERISLLASQLGSTLQRIDGTSQLLDIRRNELQHNQTILKNADTINNAYQSWQTLRGQLEKWNALAEQHHQIQNQHSELIAQIRTEEARLNEELRSLQGQQYEMEKLQQAMPGWLEELEAEKRKLQSLEDQISSFAEIEETLVELQAANSELMADNLHLKNRRQEMKNNIEMLKSAQGSQCPLCGQSLSTEHRRNMLNLLAEQGKDLGDQFREKSRLVKENEKKQIGLKDRLKAIRHTQGQINLLQRGLGQKEQNLKNQQIQLEKWKQQGEPRLRELLDVLERQSFNLEERIECARLEKLIQQLGYQPEEHKRCREQEFAVREIENDFHILEKAQTVVDGLKREISTLQTTLSGLKSEAEENQARQAEMKQQLDQQAAELPDTEMIEQELVSLRKEENILRQQVGAAQQMVDVLEKQKKREAEIQAEMVELKKKIANYRALEIAFGKDGIPALLIEQALPEIETQANDILDRLSNGRMSLSFATEREYKDRKREDKKQTLDILIGDSSGLREYELFSGGEAFRINFAIRLALARVLAQRAGARLQTLVIDEGFGSQDEEGRQRLIEAINFVSEDFAKILVITHLEDLKDAFPARIEIQKTQAGSIAEVIL